MKQVNECFRALYLILAHYFVQIKQVLYNLVIESRKAFLESVNKSD
jgi:hypothetical protein